MVDLAIEKRRKQKSAYGRRAYYTPDGRVKEICKSAKRRALSKGLPFKLTPEWVTKQIDKQNGCCAMTGIEFVYEHDKRYKRHPFSPSLDRINNDKGYTTRNVRVVCTMYNFCKNTALDEDVEYLAWRLIQHKYDQSKMRNKK